MPELHAPPLPLRRLVLGGAAVLVLLIGLGFLGREILREVETLGASSVDNLQWTLSQMDVELLRLEVAVDEAQRDPAGLPEVRKRFDIALSRARTLEAGSAFATLRLNETFDQALEDVLGFMTQTLPVIDSGDAGLAAALPEMKQGLRKVSPAAHRLGTISNEIVAAHSDATRLAVRGTLTWLALTALALGLIVLGLVVQLWNATRAHRVNATSAAATAARLNAVIEASQDPVITLDPAGRITGFSPAGESVFGLPPAEALGRDLGLLVPPQDGRPQLFLRDSPQRLRVTARHASGRDFPAVVSVSPAQAEGQPIFVLLFSDLSAQVAAENELRAARDRALAGEKAKADLLLVMSHEIRTPLNGMIGTVELMRQAGPDAKQADYLRIMADSGNLLMRHVNDILDMARLDSGKAELVAEPVDLPRLIAEVVENQRPASEAQGNRLEVAIAAGCPPVALADGGRLRQVLLNLVGNAVKFTRGGRIEVALDHRDGTYRLTVRDEGIGIPEAELDRVFEDFVTLDASFARNATGTGLGLGIVRRLVGLMGGSVSVESAPGRGSAFHLVLPLEPVAEALPPPEAPGPPPDRALHVLVVEDNDFNRLIVREMLEQEGHRVTEARDGAEGLARAAEAAFDVILLDISMPGLDGLAVLERLRGAPGPNRAAPVLALTAHAMAEDVRRFRAAGMADVLFKPLRRAALREALGQNLPPLVDAAARAEAAGSLDPAVLARLTEGFLSDMDTRMARLQGGAFAEEAHHMAGSAGVFGAAALREGLQRTLDLSRQDPEAVPRALPWLADLWAATAAAYRPDPSRPQASSLR